MTKFTKIAAWIFAGTHLALTAVGLLPSMLLLISGPWGNKELAGVIPGALLNLVITVGWFAFLSKRPWAWWLLIVSTVIALATAVSLTQVTGGSAISVRWRMPELMILPIPEIMLLYANLPARWTHKSTEKWILRKQTRVVAWMYMGLSLYVIPFAAAFLLTKLHGLDARIIATIALFAIQWLFWGVMLNGRTWAWWALIVNWTALTAIGLSNFIKPNQMGLRHSANLTGAIVYYLVLYGIPIVVLLTDIPSRWSKSPGEFPTSVG